MWSLSPGDVGGVGKLDRASMKGGILLSSCPGVFPGLIDLMPTIMIGTILPSPSSSPSLRLVPEALPRLPRRVLVLSSALLPKRNILKKLSGCWLPARLSLLSPSLFRKAEAILPFCRDCRNVSNVPSRVAAGLSSPTREAAVAAAASESSRDSTSAWSSPRLNRSMLSMGSSSPHIDRLLREGVIMLRRRRWEGIEGSALPSRLSGLSGASARGLCVSDRSAFELFLRRPSKSRSRSGICTRGRNGPRSLVLCCSVDRGFVSVVCTPRWYTGSVLRELRDGRLCRKSAMELSEERARDSLVRGRAGVASSRPDEPASCRPYSEEKRRSGFLCGAAGRE